MSDTASSARARDVRWPTRFPCLRPWGNWASSIGIAEAGPDLAVQQEHARRHRPRNTIDPPCPAMTWLSCLFA